MGSFFQPVELIRLVELTETPDHENGRAFSYLYAVKGLRRTPPCGPRSLFQTGPANLSAGTQNQPPAGTQNQPPLGT